jgi:MFS family permease
MLLALCLALFLSALELTAVATALPTITADLHGKDFVWVGSAYALASSAILPMTGGLAQIFGRRSSVIGSILLFAIGSAICGAAQNMGMLIAGRTVQGLGGGGIMSLTTIVISDIVSLEERGLYAGGCYGL